MKVNILTLFPEMFKGPFDESIVKRAQEKGLIEINIYNLRDWATDAHKSVDGRPYGGGAGMVMRIDVIDRALSSIKPEIRNPKSETKRKLQNPNSKQKTTTYNLNPKTRAVLLDATGKKYTQKDAVNYSKIDNLILVCGHYEGVDNRVHKHLVDDVVSIGDYVLSGGEIPAMILVDSIVRLLPDAIDPESLINESFSPVTNNLPPTTYLEHPQFTRPKDYKGWKVPKVLLGGNHKEIEKWRSKESIKLSQLRSEKR